MSIMINNRVQAHHCGLVLFITSHCVQRVASYLSIKLQINLMSLTKKVEELSYHKYGVASHYLIT